MSLMLHGNVQFSPRVPRLAAQVIDFLLYWGLGSLFIGSNWSLPDIDIGPNAATMRAVMGMFGSMMLTAFTILTFIQWTLLTTSGQTIGKKVIGIQIIRISDGKMGGFFRNVVVRSWINIALCMIPGYFIIDSLLIYRKDRRCLHDLFSGTAVVNVVREQDAVIAWERDTLHDIMLGLVKARG